ncbi:hypothetical protein EG68_01602 [Paragonimus skrjabini miyazakii]|uniref:Uncharacterized protein n=1 Tax=Paragonimus skrjabini miyazakii TaxID=59628 RepID=A0A8S9Z2P1_9TREM|nr:hypothetical protein EG68_01602 [Paragonimus skrjabini miyazakii]
MLIAAFSHSLKPVRQALSKLILVLLKSVPCALLFDELLYQLRVTRTVRTRLELMNSLILLLLTCPKLEIDTVTFAQDFTYYLTDKNTKIRRAAIELLAVILPKPVDHSPGLPNPVLSVNLNTMVGKTIVAFLHEVLDDESICIRNSKNHDVNQTFPPLCVHWSPVQTELGVSFQCVVLPNPVSQLSVCGILEGVVIMFKHNASFSWKLRHNTCKIRPKTKPSGFSGM